MSNVTVSVTYDKKTTNYPTDDAHRQKFVQQLEEQKKECCLEFDIVDGAPTQKQTFDIKRINSVNFI